jgi:hypothetical protein
VHARSFLSTTRRTEGTQHAATAQRVVRRLRATQVARSTRTARNRGTCRCCRDRGGRAETSGISAAGALLSQATDQINRGMWWRCVAAGGAGCAGGRAACGDADADGARICGVQAWPFDVLQADSGADAARPPALRPSLEVPESSPSSSGVHATVVPGDRAGSSVWAATPGHQNAQTRTATRSTPRNTTAIVPCRGRIVKRRASRQRGPSYARRSGGAAAYRRSAGGRTTGGQDPLRSRRWRQSSAYAAAPGVARST